VPPVSTQRRIASILSAYDDLIEINRRRISLLEEMAQRLFKEWFVEGCTGGSQPVEVTDSYLGM
jgi:type I restriction enzyme S subunit